MAWIPAQDVGGDNHSRSDELRVRASHLDLNGLTGLQPIADKLAPELGEVWRTTQPAGKIDLLALDIPRRQRKIPFSGKLERSLPETVEAAAGAEHFSGSAAGSVENGSLHASMSEAKMPYATVFRAR